MDSIFREAPMIDYRLRIVRVGIVLSAASLLAAASWLWSTSSGMERQNVSVLTLTAAGIVILAVTPWRRVLATEHADLMITLWTAMAVLALVMVESNRVAAPNALGFAMAVVFSAAATTSTASVVFTALLALAGYAYSFGTDFTDEPGATASAMLVFLAGSLVIVLLADGVRNQLAATRGRLAVLTQREQQLQIKERELSGLYQVSATIGAGSNLSEVLPELVGRVTQAVEAKTGLVLLYRPATETLDVMSPVWVAGHTVAADGYALPLTEPGLAQRVFISGDSALDNAVDGDGGDRLVADISARRIAAVPLQVEQRRIGVLLVADKASSEFTPADLTTLESLSAPAALVLNQMARYEAARATGEKMAELARLKTDFVSVVSHELRTPLTSIIGSLQTLRRPELRPENPQSQELVDSAAKQANRLRRLIEDLLVVSRLDANALPVHTEPVVPDVFLRDLVASIPGAAERTTVEIASDLTRLDADPDHLARVVTNLVENAIKYAGESPIAIRGTAAGAEVRIAVVDHGAGIPYDLREHVFDRFTQVQRHETRVRGGTGLGLSIVRGLVEAMGGRVWYEPTIGGGSTFVVAMPRTAQRLAS